MRKNRRLGAILLLAGFVLMLGLSSAYMIHEGQHECCGHHCPVCENIAHLAALLEGFALLGIAAAAVRAGGRLLCGRRGEIRARLYAAFTPVERKVRLNN